MKKLVNVLLLGILVNLFLPFFFPIKYWEDYMITFNGTKLLIEGFEPYKDFGIPTGMGNYILTFISFKLWGVNFNSMYLIQAFEHIIIIILSLCLIRSMKSNYNYLLICTFLVLYNVNLIHKVKAPFYNSEFFIYEMLSIFFILKYVDKKLNYFLYFSVFFCFLTFQTKQDFGLFNALLLASVVLYYSYFQKSLKPIYLGTLVFLACTFCFFISIDFEGFLYWFRAGQSHQPGVNLLESVFNQSAFNYISYFGLISLLLVLAKSHYQSMSEFENFFFIVVLMLFFQNFFTLGLSHFPYLNYSLPIGVIFIFHLVSKFLETHKFLVISYLLLIISPMLVEDFLFVRHFYDKNYFSGKYVKSGLPNMGQTIIPIDDELQYKRIESFIINLAKKEGRKMNILNTSQIPFNKTTYTSITKGLPLWYDEAVLLYPREKEKILSMSKKELFDVVILDHSPEYVGYMWYEKDFIKILEEHYVLYSNFDLVKYNFKRNTSCWVSKQIGLGTKLF